MSTPPRDVSDPPDERTVLARAEALAGWRLGALAATVDMPVPAHLRGHKGWVGHLLERALGATAGSRAAPDFEQIGVELKTLPVDRRGKPLESTYVSAVPLGADDEPSWEQCSVLAKLRRVLWVPVLSERGLPIGARQIGRALLWSPSPDELAQLRGDWEAHMAAVREGYVDNIRGQDGAVLQVRPKAADSHTRTWAVAPDGQLMRTNPRGFYLRATFTAAILRRHFALPEA